MELVIAAQELKEGMNKMKETFMNKYGADVFELDTEDFAMIKSMLDIFDTSLEVTCKQAETIQAINEKLDKLLAKS